MDLSPHIRTHVLSVALALSKLMDPTPSRAESMPSNADSKSLSESAPQANKIPVSEFPISDGQLQSLVGFFYEDPNVFATDLRILNGELKSTLEPQEQRFLDIAEAAAKQFQVITPTIIAVSSEYGEMNTMKVGNRSVITVTDALLDKLENPEYVEMITAGIRHEMTHVKSRLIPNLLNQAFIDSEQVANELKKSNKKQPDKTQSLTGMLSDLASNRDEILKIIPTLKERAYVKQDVPFTPDAMVREELLADKNSCMPEAMQNFIETVLNMNDIEPKHQEKLAVEHIDLHPITATRLAHLEYQKKHPPKVCRVKK